MTDYNTHQDSPNCTCCPYLLRYVRFGSCCQKKFNHPLVAIKACSPQWCATILQWTCVSIVEKDKCIASCQMLVNICPTWRMSTHTNYRMAQPTHTILDYMKKVKSTVRVRKWDQYHSWYVSIINRCAIWSVSILCSAHINITWLLRSPLPLSEEGQ